MKIIDTIDDLLDLPGKNIAFFGGSFDPPHFGHIHFIKKVVALLNINHVIICPHSLNPIKNVEQIHHRLRIMDMLFETTHDNEISILSPDVCHGIQNSIFIDDIVYLLKRRNKEVFVLIGCDSLKHCTEPFKAADVTFIIGCGVDTQKSEQQIYKQKLKCIFIEDFIPCSTNELNESLEMRRSYLSKEVLEYIENNHLYWNNSECNNCN